METIVIFSPPSPILTFLPPPTWKVTEGYQKSELEWPLALILSLYKCKTETQRGPGFTWGHTKIQGWAKPTPHLLSNGRLSPTPLRPAPLPSLVTGVSPIARQQESTAPRLLWSPPRWASLWDQASASSLNLFCFFWIWWRHLQGVGERAWSWVRRRLPKTEPVSSSTGQRRWLFIKEGSPQRSDGLWSQCVCWRGVGRGSHTLSWIAGGKPRNDRTSPGCWLLSLQGQTLSGDICFPWHPNPTPNTLG